MNFQLYSSLRKKYPDVVVGMDLSGDHDKGRFMDYKHIFDQARLEGFGLALHCGETKNDDETLDMIKFMTSQDRIGHGTFINGNFI